MGVGNHTRLQTTLRSTALSAIPTKSFSPPSSRGSSHETGNWVEKHAIEATPRGCGFLSTLFLVPPKKVESEACSQSEKCVYTEHFKMEGIHILRDLLRAGDWMTKVGVRDAYFMLPIHEEDRTFLKFSFKERTYQWWQTGGGGWGLGGSSPPYCQV